MKKRYIAAAALLIAIPAIAIAKEGGERGHGKRGAHFERLDTDKDGKITAEEARAASPKMIERVDTNADGVITPDEAPRMFERIDADGDGKITSEELGAISASRIMRADADGDGAVTREEAKAAREKMKAARGERNRRHDKDEAPPAETPAPAPTEAP